VASPEFCTRFGFVERPKIINVYRTTPGSTLYSRVSVIALGLCVSFKITDTGYLKAQLMLTNPHDAFSDQSMSLNTVSFDMLGMAFC